MTNNIMIFAIQVLSSPYSSQASYTAYQFANSLLSQGHRLHRVFFYYDGAQNATKLATPPQDEFDLHAAWRELSLKHNTDLVVCISAALRRGILNEEEASRYQKDAFNLAKGFDLGGLGQLIEAAVTSDRLITFGY